MATRIGRGNKTTSITRSSLVAPDEQSLAAQNKSLVIARARTPIFRFSGRDAERYLHGRLTQNIKALESGHSARSLLLSSQGKIQGNLLVRRDEGTFTVISDPLPSEEMEAELLRTILQFKVSDEVTAENLSEQFRLIQIFGPDGESALLHHVRRSGDSVIREQLGPFSLIQILTNDSRLPEKISTAASCPLGDESSYQTLRLRAGMPQMHIDFDEKALAPELDITPFVSFEKGCYTGQEVVEMATARGRPNRKLMHLSCNENFSDVAAGEQIFLGDGAVSGFVTSCAFFSPERKSYLFAFLRASVVNDKAEFFLRGSKVTPV